MGSHAATGTGAGHAGRVRTLFDHKAAGWPAKYAADGPFVGRLTSLARTVTGLAEPGGAVLDLGCGSGELARHLAAGGYRVTGCDIAPEMLRRAAAADVGHAVRWIRLEPCWRTLPFADASLDAVIASSVLEYVADPRTVLAECARVLRPSGIMVCTVPDMTHPVRWLEWPLRLTARSLPPLPPGRAARRVAHYLAYLRGSCQRRGAGWWCAAAARSGLATVPAQRMARAPLRLVVFVRSGGTTRLPGSTGVR